MSTWVWVRVHDLLLLNCIFFFLVASEPPPPPVSAPDPSFVPCPTCGRTFNPTAAERHIPRCKSIIAKVCDTAVVVVSVFAA